MGDPSVVAELSGALVAEMGKDSPRPNGTISDDTATHRVLLIDVAHLFYQSWHATADREVGEAFTKTLERVAWVRSRVRHNACAICCDHGPYWRHKIDPNYKAQRQRPSEAMMDQFARVRERLARDGLLVWRFEGFEADDVIGTACQIAKERGIEVVIASGDKDLMQCISESCTYFSTNSGHEMGVGDCIEKFGVPPEQMPDLLALWGDTSDNVPGIPGVGQKKAAALLSKFGNAPAAVEAARAGDMTIPKAVSAALVEHWKNYAWALQLVSLRTDVPLQFDDLFEERETLPLSEENDMAEEFDEHPQEPTTPEQPVAHASMVVDTPAPQPTTQLARVSPQSFEMGLEPVGLGQAVKLAQGLHNSRLYQRFPNADAITAVIIRGREMGLGALTALDCFHVIEGKPSPQAHLLIARAKAHPDCEYFQLIESTADSVTYETKNRRNPRPTRHTYSLDMAKRAGICPEEMRRRDPRDPKDSRGQWEKRPDEMLRKTCAVQLARIEYPDAVLGLVAFEELDS